MLPSVSAQGCPWWKHKRTMGNSHWVCREGLQFTREREEMPAGVFTTPATCHSPFTSEPFSKGAPGTLSSVLSSTVTNPTRLCRSAHYPSSSPFLPMTTSFSESGQQISQPHWLTGLLFRADTAHVHRICTHYVLLFNKMITSMIRPLGSWGHSLYASHHVPGICSEANM